MDLAAFRERLSYHEQESACLNSEEKREALVLADCSKRFSRQRAQRAIQLEPEVPMLMVHMSDGWGAWCNTTSKSDVIPGTHLVVTRTGNFRHEFLLQRALVRLRDVAGGQRLFLLVGDPEGLNKGKGAWNVLAGACRFMKTLREMGHRGLCANVYIADGALYQPLARTFAARHRFQAKLGKGKPDELLRLEMQEFTIAIKCASHGCNNGTKWGLKVCLTSPEIVDDAHICTKSCMNSSTAFHAHIDLFLLKYVDYATERSAPDADIRAFWLASAWRPQLQTNWCGRICTGTGRACVCTQSSRTSRMPFQSWRARFCT